jgi:hypothetical protein
VPSLQFSSLVDGDPQSDGQLHEFSLFCLHIPSPQNGLPASAIFAIAQTKHAVNNKKTKKFLFDTIIFSFRCVDLNSCVKPTLYSTYQRQSHC